MIPACDQKHCAPPTTTACAVMMRSAYNNGGLLGVSRCSVFVMNSLVLLEYTGCYLWYLVFVSNFGMCYSCTVSYCIVSYISSSERIAICTVAFVFVMCRCIVSALLNRQQAIRWTNDSQAYWCIYMCHSTSMSQKRVPKLSTSDVMPPLQLFMLLLWTWILATSYYNGYRAC